MPKRFLERFKINRSDRIVYIKRNIHDVLVSSFFYFRYKGDEKYILKKPSTGIIINPFKLYKYLERRRIFSKYVKEFCINGHKDFGKWTVHCDLWRGFMNNNKSIKSTITLYENLMSNTKGELLNILRNLGLNNTTNTNIQKIVMEESFSERKKKILSTKKELTFGKEFNLRFLRKGTPGDYKRFLNSRQISYINSFIKE